MTLDTCEPSTLTTTTSAAHTTVTMKTKTQKQRHIISMHRMNTIRDMKWQVTTWTNTTWIQLWNKRKWNLSVFPVRLLKSQTYWSPRMDHEVINDWCNCRELTWHMTGHRFEKKMTAREFDLSEKKAIISSDEVLRTVGKTTKVRNKWQIEIPLQIIYRSGSPVRLHTFIFKSRLDMEHWWTSCSWNGCKL